MEVVVTGMGAVSSLGTGCDALLEALRTGRDGLRPTSRFETTQFVSALAGTWPEWEGRVQPRASPTVTLAESAAVLPAAEMALRAAREAWAAAGLGEDGARGRVTLLLGTCFGQGFSLFNELTEAVAAALGLRGPCLTISTACSSSTNAIGLGRDLLCAGRSDVVVAGGVDVLLREVFAGFNALGVLSREKCAPFGHPYGTTLGEGAGFVVLERAADAARRGVRAVCTIDGYGLSADAHHETSPDPTGAGIERAIRGALADAGGDGPINHVNAHATGTESNDRPEWAAIARALAPCSAVPVSGLKSFLAHAMGAAGVLELILGVLAMGEGRLPPTLRCGQPRPGAPPDPVPAARPTRVQRALDISAAFGGANAVLVYGAPDRPRPRAGGTPAAPVLVRGVAAVTPAGIDLAALGAAVRAGRALAGPAAQFDLGAIVPTVDPRRLDPSGRLLTAAAALALRDAGIVLKGKRREETGLFLAAARMPRESSTRCQESLDRHGPARMSAAAFARMSVNAPAGACCKHLALKGPSTTVSIGAGSGLFALAYAAQWLAQRQDAQLLLAGAVDEAPGAGPAFEGAACAVLERASGPPEPGAIAVVGWGLAGPDQLAAAARAALADAPFPDGVLGDGASGRTCLAGLVRDAAALPLGFCDVGATAAGEACAAALAFALAVLALREGRARSLLVTASRGRSATVAVLLRRSE